MTLCLKGRCQYSQSTQSTLLQHRLIPVTAYRRSVILAHLTGADVLQLGHTAVTVTVGLKPHTTPLNTCFRLESATFVSRGYSAEQCSLMQGACCDHIDPLWCNHEDCDNEITWEDCVWNVEDQVWEFLIYYSCVGHTSQHCAEHGGSCCNGDTAPRNRRGWSRSSHVENGWTMDDDHFDAVVINAPQSPTTGRTQLSHGFVRTTYGAVNTRFGPGVDFAGFDLGPGFVNTHPLYINVQ